MPIPSRVEAARIVLGLGPPAWFLAHVRAVAETASFLARAAAGRHVAVDRRLVEAAALLHDVDKLLPAGHPLKRFAHGDAGARWLSERGHAELAPAVAAHPVTRLADDDFYLRWLRSAALEERIVAYADKRAAQRLGPLASRFADWERRHPEHAPSLRAALARAQGLEREVCAAAGVGPEAVHRVRWTADAFRRARAEERAA